MPYSISDDLIDEIREKNDILDVISEYLSLKRAGVNYKSLCPFHTEKTPSFTVSPQKQIFHCFGCGEGGDVITFIMKQENLSFIEAVKFLADRVGIPIEEKQESVKNSIIREEKNILFQINREAALYFFNNLKSNKKANKYLTKRGIDYNTIKTYGIGYSNDSWDDLLNHLKSKGYKEIDIEKAGLIIKRKDNSGFYDRFRGRIIFPIIDTRGRVIGFGGRVLDNSQPKYLNSPETPVFSKGYNLYGLNIAKKNPSRDIILVEGYMDVISLYKNGITYGVASLGTALTENQSKLIKRYADNVYICYDTDIAGQNATQKAIDVLRKVGLQPRVVLLPEGKDPDEYIKHNSKENFETLIKNSLNYVNYKIYVLKKKFDIKTVEGKIEFTKKIANILKQNKSAIEVDAYIKQISMDTGISIEAIESEVYRNNTSKTSKIKDKYIFNNYRYNNKDKIEPVKYNLEPGHLMAEKCLINLIIKSKNVYTKIKDFFMPEHFLNKTYRKLASILYEGYESKEEIIIEDLDQFFNSEELKEVEDAIQLELSVENTDIDKAVDDYINKIHYYKLKIKRNEIKEQLKLLETNKEKSKGDVEKFKELCLRLMEIDKELKLHQ